MDVKLLTDDKHATVKRFFSENLVQIDISVSIRSPEIGDSGPSGDFNSRHVGPSVSEMKV